MDRKKLTPIQKLSLTLGVVLIGIFTAGIYLFAYFMRSAEFADVEVWKISVLGIATIATVSSVTIKIFMDKAEKLRENEKAEIKALAKERTEIK
jgi:predicted membrane protein